MIRKENAPGGESKLTQDVQSMLDVGGIKNTDTLQSGMTFTSFVKKLLQTIFFPALNDPTFSLSSDKASMLESGTITNIVLSANYNPGSIIGKLVAGAWQALTKQADRCGAAIKYTFGGIDNLLVNTHTVVSQAIVDGNNIFSATIQHAAGIQPTDSAGANYNLPYVAATESVSLNILGKRNCFYGNTSTATPLGDTVRTLPYTLINPVNGTTFPINIPLHAQTIVFAYPSSLEDVSTVKYVEGLNAEVKGVFTQTLVNVEGANGYTAILYKVYTYTPATPFSTTATYNVTI